MEVNMGQYIIAYFVGAILLVISLILLARPIKWVLKLIFSCMLGFVGLLGFNLVGGLAGLYIGVNIITAVTVGVLGMPGLALLLFVRYIV